MKKINRTGIIIFCLCGIIALGGCGLTQLINLFKCTFSLAGISDITWAGINLSEINNVRDLSVGNFKKAGNAILDKNYVVRCNVNVNVKNETKRAARLIAYDYQLDLDGMPLASGSSKDKSYTIDAQSVSRVAVPLQVDLLGIIKHGEIDNILNFVRNLKGYGKGKESTVRIKFTPYVSVGGKSMKMAAIILNKTFQ